MRWPTAVRLQEEEEHGGRHPPAVAKGLTAVLEPDQHVEKQVGLEHVLTGLTSALGPDLDDDSRIDAIKS